MTETGSVSSSAGEIQFIGTATTLIRYGELTLLTDPNFLHKGQRAYLGWGLSSRRRTDPAMRVEALPALDAVVLSHLHGDHFDRVARRGLPGGTQIVTTPHAAGSLANWGLHPVPLRTWEQHEISHGDTTVRITSMPGVHAHGLMGKLLPPVMGARLEFSRGGRRELSLYITGDTLLGPHVEQIASRYPDTDLAIVHLGGTRVLGMLVTMDGDQGADLLATVRPRAALPVHIDDYGVFKSPLSDFESAWAQHTDTTQVTVLRRGETYDLRPRVAY